MSWQRDGDEVVIRLTNDQFNSLLLNLGYVVGAKSGRDEPVDHLLRLVNAVNEGNPNWTPYAVEPEAGQI